MAQFVKKNLSLQDKVFLVTGGAGGVGAGIVRTLLENNARHVAFLDVAEREGSALETELLAKFGALKAKFIKCDVADDEQLDAAFKLVLHKYYRLDGVINNAAVLSINERSFKKMIDVNFYATVKSTTTALDILAVNKGGNGGVIINISSLLALNLGTHLPVYAATKTAVLQFSIAMGKEELYSTTGVRVMTVCLGPTDTPLLSRTTNFEESSPVVSRVTNRQSVKSAVKGIMDIIENGKSGSTWIVKNDEPAIEYTDKLTKAFEVMSET